MQRFNSKVDWWLAAIVISVPLISVGTTISGLASGDMAAAAIGAGTVVGVVALYIVVVWPVAYEVDARELVVRFGLMRNRVPLDQIARIAPSRNPLASPALSLDRLRLDRRGGGIVLVSPADRAGFVRAITSRAPGVEVDERLAG